MQIHTALLKSGQIDAELSGSPVRPKLLFLKNRAIEKTLLARKWKKNNVQSMRIVLVHPPVTLRKPEQFGTI